MIFCDYCYVTKMHFAAYLTAQSKVLLGSYLVEQGTTLSFHNQN